MEQSNGRKVTKSEKDHCWKKFEKHCSRPIERKKVVQAVLTNTWTLEEITLLSKVHPHWEGILRSKVPLKIKTSK